MTTSIELAIAITTELELWTESIGPSKHEVDAGSFDLYASTMCLKNTKSGPRAASDHQRDYMKSSDKLRDREALKYLCVLPTGHVGKCSHQFNPIFDMTNPVAKKLLQSMSSKVYSTPGNDGVVYKNRASRLYPDVLSSTEERKLRNTDEKKKCAIPLKDASTPLLLAQASMDWLTFLINVPGVKDLLTADEHKQTYLEYFDSHKRFLTDYYQCFNRKIFDPNGNTICCITGHQLCMSDISDITRDNRFDIKDTDLQMGHNIPRQEGFITIRGCNLIPMSRRGNLIIGEKVFTENAWVDELRRICSYY